MIRHLLDRPRNPFHIQGDYGIPKLGAQRGGQSGDGIRTQFRGWFSI